MTGAVSIHADPEADVALYVRGLGKQYEGTQALRWGSAAELNVAGGEIHALVGENGAGKSTMMSILAGLCAPSAGAIQLAGNAYAPGNIAHAREHGVEIVLQEPGLISSLTVAENFFLGRTTADTTAGFVRGRRSRRQVQQALAAVAPHVSATAAVSSLSLEDQKMVELARAVFFSPTLLLIDEMTACLGQSAVRRLFAVLREQRHKGAAVLYISHYLEEVRELCDRVTVLRDGQLVATLPTADADDRTLTSLMVGRDIQATLYRSDETPRTGDRPVLAVDGLGLPDSYRDVSFEVRAGEILGIGGLVGCGSDPLARTLFGAMRSAAGSMTLDQAPYRPHSPRQAIRCGIAYVPPDRDREGLLLGLPIATNVTLPMLPQLATGGFYAGRREPGIAKDLISRLAIRCRGAQDLPRALSGGNRQKVVLAKWLLADPKVFILHNPTRGIDVGAKAEIYRLIDELATAGAAVLLISDELPELIGMSDRILIMRRGEITHRTARDIKPTADELITYMV